MKSNRSRSRRSIRTIATSLVLCSAASAYAQLSLPNVFDQPLQTVIHASTVTAGTTTISVSGGEIAVTSGYNGENSCPGLTYQSTPITATGDPYFGHTTRVCVRQTTSAQPGRTTEAVVIVGGARHVFRATTAGVLQPDDDADGDAIPNGVEAAEGRNPRAKDNDVFSSGGSSARLFAMQQYRDFLGREGDPAGIQGWADFVTAGTYSHPQVIDAFVNSPEFSGFVAPVVRLYFATFLRIPDSAGLNFNAGLVRAGTVTLAQLADFFVASPEFVALYGALDNTAFVTLLYQNVLSRAPDPAGLSGWVGFLDGGMSRGQVLLGFSESAEYQVSMANEVLVTMMYTAMLRRTPEPAGFNGWVAFLDALTYTREQVINGFFLSTEYRDRFLSLAPAATPFFSFAPGGVAVASEAQALAGGGAFNIQYAVNLERFANAGPMSVTVEACAPGTGCTATSVQDYFLEGDGIDQGFSWSAPYRNTLTFAPGETSRTFTMAVADNLLSDATRTLTFSLLNPTNGAVLGMPSVQSLQILDNEPPPTTIVAFASSELSILEKDPAGLAYIAVTRSSGVGPASVKAVLQSTSTGLAGTHFALDYAASPFSGDPPSYTIAFSNGETSKGFWVRLLSVAGHEGNRTAVFALQNPVNLLLGSAGTATLTILESDPPPPMPGIGTAPDSGRPRPLR